MGQLGVTPVVYKHLFLTEKENWKDTLFLGPTMIHHSKDFQTYKVLSLTCVSSCKGLKKAKGYITDGEDALDKAWRTEIPKARHLRCMKHFESNCKQKLNSIGIKEGKQQKIFLRKVSGELNENNGIVDAENKSDVKSRLTKCKLDLDDKEIHLLQKNEDYIPKFSQYIEDRQDIISKSMSLKARRNAHMPVDEKGTSLCPYTNSSESMNNVMSQAKNDFLRYNNKGKKTRTTWDSRITSPSQTGDSQQTSI